MANRYKVRWECALNGKMNIGCGINALTFVDLVSSKEGQDLMNDPETVTHKGTSFAKMMQLASKKEGVKLYKHSYTINSEEDVEKIFISLKHHLGKDSCTAVKMMRYGDNDTKPTLCNGTEYTPGHSVVFATDGDGKLYQLDPQQADPDPEKPDPKTRKPPRLQENAKKTFSVWKNNCYVSMAVMVKKRKSSLNKSVKVHKPTGLQKKRETRRSQKLTRQNLSRSMIRDV